MAEVPDSTAPYAFSRLYCLIPTLSGNDGRTWKWTRHIKKHDSGQYHYPSIIQSRDGRLHVTYTYAPNLSAIKHARFNVGWVKAGD